jgi:adenosylmethionine-8-amino-7-oxononanoate aminotransferase
MTHILHRAANAEMPVAAGGKGIELFDRNGASYIDASGGAAVSCLGHGHPDVLAALHKQLDTIAYAHTGFFTTEIAEKLADRLIETAPRGIDHVYLVSGGSEAIEAALKMARQYFVEKGQPQRRHIIARRQSYHGNTLGALATGGNEWRRAQFRPLLIETHHIDPCYAYRLQDAGESDLAYAARAAQALEDKILELGSDQVIAFVAETVVGATSGAVPPVADYFKRIRAPANRTASRRICWQSPKASAAVISRLGRSCSARQFSRPSRKGPASSSTATHIWAIRWPLPPGLPCRT